MDQEWSKMKLGLDRFRTLLDALDHPERLTPSILVGGTNGKGSVAAMLSSILTAAGYRTGLYSSPHLLSYRERIRVDGRAISRPEVAAGMEILAPAMAVHGASFFEAMTGLAFIHFARRQVDVAVLEVGIGGTLDATNVVDPLTSVVASVGIDHTEVLGRTLAKIARDKAGIARRKRPLVIAADGRARETLLRAAESCGAESLVLGQDARYRVEELRSDSSRFSFSGPAFRAGRLELGLAGRHQVRNAACALLALGTLKAFPATPGIRPGLASLRWPGRLELLAPWLLVDGAHNPMGARALADHLGRFHGERRVVAMVGMVGARRPYPFARALGRSVDGVVVTQPPDRRAIPATSVAGDFRRAGFRGWLEPEPARALERARDAAGGDGLVVVCGSLYLVAAVLRLAGRRPVEVI